MMYEEPNPRAFQRVHNAGVNASRHTLQNLLLLQPSRPRLQLPQLFQGQMCHVTHAPPPLIELNLFSFLLLVEAQ